jgi:hypothetical protein
LCKNAKTLNRDRRNYSSKTALVAQLASEFNLEVELKNIILVAFRFFEFLHSQGQKRRFGGRSATFGSPRSTDISRPGRQIRKPAHVQTIIAFHLAGFQAIQKLLSSRPFRESPGNPR